MKTLYLDIFSGISGDMFIGALIDLGVDADALAAELKKLDVEGYHLHAERRTKAGINGIKFDVHLENEGHAHEHHAHDHDHAHGSAHTGHDHSHEQGHSHSSHGHSHEHGHAHEHTHDDGHEHGHHHHHHDDSRNFADIKQLIETSQLNDWVKEKSVAVFHRIAVAEGKIHGHPPEDVHFHEVGAVDSIMDIVGGCVGMDLLGRPRVLASPAVEGHGWVNCAHGRFPVPTMATLEILGARGVALDQCEEPHELITPTGAALLAEFAESFAPMRGLVAEKVGYGLGTRDNHTRPNVLRAVLGTASTSKVATEHDWETDTVAVLETNLDDVNAEWLGALSEALLADGALDVFFTPVQMKKNRPGTLLTVLCANDEADAFTARLLSETTAFGVRRSEWTRRKLRRESIVVETEFGPVSVKIGRLNGVVVQFAPEFESCRIAAQTGGVPIKRVYAAAARAAVER